MQLIDFINTIETDPEFGPAVAHHRYLPSSRARYGTGARLNLNPRLESLLRQMGIERLFHHQVRALEHIREGKNVIVATPTASGKSLIYNLAVLETRLQKENAKSLYLFPLKALEQDQMKALSQLTRPLKDINVSVKIYDGDTSPYRRKQIRAHPPDILFTNPDMLHRGIMAYHESWKPLFENLNFIILDEVHTYRGIFGSHMNQIIRRLRRICRHYGADPRFILLSATINNPGQFGQSLIEAPVEVIGDSGSPKAGQHILFLNPEASANFSAARLFSHCLRAGFRTIVFTQSRKVTELIHVWVSQLTPELRRKISSYRAGFMPAERREIERKLADGELLGVVSTSALEMGIDIGCLDVCLLVGYPGTMINTWQRGGRVGRSGRESLILLMAKPDALDQYFMRHPDDFFGRNYEAAILDPHNPYVVEAHLPCAAAEIPLTLDDGKFWSGDILPHLEKLEQEGVLARSVDGEPCWYAVKRNPHLGVNIRSAGGTYTIFENRTGQAIGLIDGVRALKECHPGAIYLHKARQYHVEDLSLKKKDIIVSPIDMKYFTRALSEKETEIIKVERSRPRLRFLVKEGVVKVTEQVTGYEKRALPGQELIGTFSLDLPERTFETIGFWIEIEPVIKQAIEGQGLHFMGGIHAIEHASIGLFPLFALCDRNDIGGICYTHHPQVGKAAIFIYDGHPGGVGLAQRGFEVIAELLEKTLNLLRTCECEEGCPSCIHSPKCGSGNKPLDKQAAALILELLLDKRPLDEFVDGSSSEETPDPVMPPLPVEPQPRKPRLVYFDLETQRLAQDVGGWRNIHLMGLSVGVVYDSLEERYRHYTEDEVDGLIDHLKKADLVVGFNVRRFDYTVLNAYTTDDLLELCTFDILEDIHKRLGFRIGLDHLARATLNQCKLADGIQAVKWFREGEMKKLAEYCQQDVTATRDLFLFGLENRHLIYRSKKDNCRLRLPVDWDLKDMMKRK